MKHGVVRSVVCIRLTRPVVSTVFSILNAKLSFVTVVEFFVGAVCDMMGFLAVRQAR